MKRSMCSILAVVFLASLVILQTGCDTEVEGGASGSGSINGDGNLKGEVKVEIKVKIRFSPKPAVLDEVIMLEMLNGLSIDATTFPVAISVSTDKGFAKNLTFTAVRNTRLAISPLLTGTRLFIYTPQNKTALDAFLKEAMANTDALMNATLSFRVGYVGKLTVAKGTPVVLNPQNTGVRLRLLPNETAPLVKLSVNVPIKTIS
jgi:hypothetical protein